MVLFYAPFRVISSCFSQHIDMASVFAIICSETSILNDGFFALREYIPTEHPNLPPSSFNFYRNAVKSFKVDTCFPHIYKLSSSISEA
jgi:hypothetical protein